MAQIETSNQPKKQVGVRKTKKLSTKVDLTPMVDLDFLLITFFIFTTTMAQPTAMRLIMPDDKPMAQINTAGETKVITLLLDKDENVYYYSGKFKGVLEKTDFSSVGLRTILLSKMSELEHRHINRSELIVLIKASDRSSYGNIVDALDEMTINGIKRYMLLDLTQEEFAALTASTNIL